MFQSCDCLSVKPFLPNVHHNFDSIKERSLNREHFLAKNGSMVSDGSACLSQRPSVGCVDRTRSGVCGPNPRLELQPNLEIRHWRLGFFPRRVQHSRFLWIWGKVKWSLFVWVLVDGQLHGILFFNLFNSSAAVSFFDSGLSEARIEKVRSFKGVRSVGWKVRSIWIVISSFILPPFPFPF